MQSAARSCAVTTRWIERAYTGYLYSHGIE